MRIVLDMQGAQTESRFRGIGRYVLGFAKGVARTRGEHEVILALSGLMPDAIESIRGEFEGLLPQENIRVWHAPGPVEECTPGNEVRRQVAEVSREAFLASLQPDVVHIGSLFEGVSGYGVTSVGEFDTTTPVSVLLHDLIPLVNSAKYLDPHPLVARWYHRKVSYLKRSAILLANSNFTREEGLEHLGLPENQIVAVSSATDDLFKPMSVSADQVASLREKFGIDSLFLLYTGGADERKNLPRLIDAYAQLPVDLRVKVQLVFAGKLPPIEADMLRQHAKKAGIGDDRFRLTGYISDDELLQLYNLCQAFVFPSWHEGFGLPALEAMACGAPVICSNASSLPEVVGRDDVLFDPTSVQSIADKMIRVLRDDVWRKDLHEYGLEQSKRFSWDIVGRRAISAWENMARPKALAWRDRSQQWDKLRNKLAMYLIESRDDNLSIQLSACLAQNAQEAQERQLLVDVSELCQHDAGTGVQRLVRNYLRCLLQSPPEGYRVEPVYATGSHGYRYARKYTQHVLGVSDAGSGVCDSTVQWQRGDIFFGLDMQHHVHLAHREFFQVLRTQGVAVKFLVYDLLPIEMPECFWDPAITPLHKQLMEMIASMDGAICISKATSDALLAWIQKEGIATAPNFQSVWVHCGVETIEEHEYQLSPEALQTLMLIKSRPSFLCVSTIEPRKRQEQVLDAVEGLWAQGQDVNLVFVGRQGWKMEAFSKRLSSHAEAGKRLFWLQGIDDGYLDALYKSATCLISASLNEGFGLPLIEAAQHGLPIIARDIPVFHEVAGDTAWYFSGDTSEELQQALLQWLALYREGKHPVSRDMKWLTWAQSTEMLKGALTQQTATRQLLLDISELVQHDAKSGIQRVVRSILKEWLTNPPAGYRVEPVYATLDQPYRYARKYVAHFMGKTSQGLADDVMEYSSRDVFLGLDLSPPINLAQASFYQKLRRQGVRVQFVVYDLLALRLEYFEPPVVENYRRWLLEVVAQSDGAICISKAVHDEVVDWMKAYGPKRYRPFSHAWFHLGADMDNSMPTRGVPEGVQALLQSFQSSPSFLMVGTLEPRKGHAQVLDAFEVLWKTGKKVQLVIVGKQGWKSDSLVDRIRSHEQYTQQLFWLEQASDEFLQQVYKACTCLIAASYGEGFGLPLIEAAQYQLPILARDIPVFREVARDHAAYFKAENAMELSAAILRWLEQNEAGNTPTSTDMPSLTWKQSAQQLAKLLPE